MVTATIACSFLLCSRESQRWEFGVVHELCPLVMHTLSSHWMVHYNTLGIYRRVISLCVYSSGGQIYNTRRIDMYILVAIYTSTGPEDSSIRTIYNCTECDKRMLIYMSKDDDLYNIDKWDGCGNQDDMSAAAICDQHCNGISYRIAPGHPRERMPLLDSSPWIRSN